MRYRYFSNKSWDLIIAVLVSGGVLFAVESVLLSSRVQNGEFDRDGTFLIGLFSVLCLVAPFAIWIFSVSDISPCLDINKMTVNYWACWMFPQKIRIGEIKDMTRDYHLSFSKEGHARESFTVRLLGMFGSRDFTFGGRRARDEFEHLVQAAVDGELVGNTSVPPSARLVFNLCFTLFIFVSSQVAVVVKVPATKTAVARMLGLKLQQATQDETVDAMAERLFPADGAAPMPVETNLDDNIKRPSAEKPKFEDALTTQKSDASSAMKLVEDSPRPPPSPVSNDVPTLPLRSSEAGVLKLKIAELQGDLAVINSKIEA